MDISSSYLYRQYRAQHSLLRSANKQPELALELIMKTAQSLESVPGLQSPSETVPKAPSSSSAVGQIVDIVA